MSDQRGISVWIILFVSAILALFFPAEAAKASPLVSVDWLQKNISRKDLVVVDTSQTRLYRQKHIPGAVSADVFSFGGRVLTPADMQKIVQSWGVNTGMKVVFYDEGASYMATSIFFDLYNAGFPLQDMFILDGGLAKWEALGGATTKEATAKPQPGNVRVASGKVDARALLPEFASASGNSSKALLVEGLDPEYYYGGAKFFDRAGHVPNAVMMPSDDLFNADKTFKSKAEIQRIFTHVGITPDRSIYTYCGGGVAASLSFFAAKFLLEYPEVKLFKGSQREWLRDDRGLPFWTYAAPNLLRDRQWVNGWNNDMMRMMGVAELNIIDTRSVATRARGHIAHDLHIPASVFRVHARDLPSLANALGAAQVVKAHEAVIVSDGGITPDAALALLLLEKMGHEKVSILNGSVDDWALAGLPVVKANSATADNGATKPTVAPAKPARTYAFTSNSNLPASAKQTNSAMPRIYLVVGKNMPATLPNGTVKHLPYTDLLKTDGSPKAANEIWQSLQKVGVSRYAEIVTVADDTGEAAVGYVVLKMMGFPHVSVITS